jgi:hypothetical protein
MQNRDDPVLGDGGIDFVTRMMGSRARIYADGGHHGNLQYADNVDYMLHVMTGPDASHEAENSSASAPPD